MARIRSIHPGIWTDEAFVGLSPFARLFYIGLWNECDDKGIFPWSALKMKMRILPADNVDANDLLGEIEVAGLIKSYEHSEKKFGAVRNFRKHQRPKKPNDIFPASPEILSFCGISEEPKLPKRPTVPNQFPTGGENAPQMEDGGCRMEGLVPKGTCASGDAPEDDFTISDFVESWNDVAAKCSLARIAKVTEARRRAFNVRKRQYPDIDDWKKAFRSLAENEWMHGDNKNGWRADADFFLQAKSFTKLVEGAYAKADR